MSKNGGSVLNVLSFCHPHGDHLGSLLNMLIPDPHPRLPVVECVCVCACVCVRACVFVWRGGGAVTNICKFNKQAPRLLLRYIQVSFKTHIRTVCWTLWERERV